MYIYCKNLEGAWGGCFKGGIYKLFFWGRGHNSCMNNWGQMDTHTVSKRTVVTLIFFKICTNENLPCNIPTKISNMNQQFGLEILKEYLKKIFCNGIGEEMK
jgi:hypothetical protein